MIHIRASTLPFGKFFANMMVDLQLTNKKLEERTKRIIMIATSCDYARAIELLAESGGSVKIAIIMQRAKCSKEEAIRALAESDGFVERAIQHLKLRMV